MAILSQIARPLSWLTTFKARGTHADAIRSVKDVTAAPAISEATPGVVQWVGNHLTLPRELDASCYHDVIAAAQQIYTSGESEILVDLREVAQVELSGLFALHCLALTMRGQTLPDPTDGWHALRTAAEQNLAAGCCEQVKLINGSARVTAKLQANQLDRCLLIVP
jgi:hypothetical protein